MQTRSICSNRRVRRHFFDLRGIIFALHGIRTACSLAERRVLTAEEERIIGKRSVHAEPMPEAYDQHQEL